MEFNPAMVSRLQKRNELKEKSTQKKNTLETSGFEGRALNDFINDEEAYHQLMLDIISQQYVSTQLVLKGTRINRIFVDGGFSKNAIYMNLLAAHFPGVEVFAATMAQSTAVGTALSIHDAWNQKAMTNDIIELKKFSSAVSCFVR